jgi:copper(I)-binding protein
MTQRLRSRRGLLGWSAATVLAPWAAGLAHPVSAHSFAEDGFTVLHPWCDEARAGATGLPVLLRIVDIQRVDRLLGAETPVASRMLLHLPPRPGWAAAAPSASNDPPGLPLQPGHDLNLSHFGPHLLLTQVLTDLHFGREYPLTLHFEQAGRIEAALIIGLD